MTEPTTAKSPADSLAGFDKAAYDSVAADTNQYNSLTGQIEAVTGDPQALLENLRQTSDDPKVVAIRKKIEAANEALLKLETERDTILKAEVDRIRKDAEAQVETLKAKAAELEQKISAGRSYLKKLVSPEVFETLPAVHRKNARKGGGGGGGRRIRGYNVSVNGKKYDNVSTAAKDLKVDTETFQGPFFAKVGDARPDSVNVTVSINGADVPVTFNKV